MEKAKRLGRAALVHDIVKLLTKLYLTSPPLCHEKVTEIPRFLKFEFEAVEFCQNVG